MAKIHADLKDRHRLWVSAPLVLDGFSGLSRPTVADLHAVIWRRRYRILPSRCGPKKLVGVQHETFTTMALGSLGRQMPPHSWQWSITWILRQAPQRRTEALLRWPTCSFQLAGDCWRGSL